jgi:hypothetical protein
MRQAFRFRILRMPILARTKLSSQNSTKESLSQKPPSLKANPKESPRKKRTKELTKKT